MKNNFKPLKIGEKNNPEVASFLQKLADLGLYKMDANPEWRDDAGPGFQKAVSDFQRLYMVNGEIDELTAQKINAVWAANEQKKTTPVLDFKHLKITQVPLNRDEYMQEKTEKSGITLHLNGGSNSGYFTKDTFELDRNSVTFNQFPVATHFAIAGEFVFAPNPALNCKDGEIFQMLPLENWAYHINGNPLCNKWNIGIEICNRAYLTYRNGVFVATGGVIIPENEVEEFDFRGFKYWHKITDPQLDSTFKVIRASMSQYPEIAQAIKNQKFDATWSDFKPEAPQLGLKGVGTHTNYFAPNQFMRWDMPPFPRVLEMLRGL